MVRADIGSTGVRIMSDWPDGWYQNQDGSYRRPARPDEAPPTAAYQGRSQQASRSGWPEQPGRSSGGGGGTGRSGTRGRRPGGRRRRFWGQPGRHGRRIMLVAGVVIVVLIVALAGSYFWLDGKLNRTVVLPAFTGTSAGQNWLIAGSDTRSGLTDQQIRSLHVGFDFGTTNSDSLLLLHMGTGRPVLISIPRDSYVPIPGYGDNKINAALGFGGPSLLIKTVENVTGLHINHYMGIGFGGLVSVVNNIGGVTICLPKALHDEDSGANLKAGCQV